MARGMRACKAKVRDVYVLYHSMLRLTKLLLVTLVVELRYALGIITSLSGLLQVIFSLLKYMHVLSYSYYYEVFASNNIVVEKVYSYYKDLCSLSRAN